MSYLSSSPEKQQANFEELVKRLQSIGLEEFSLERRKLENKLIGLSSATKDRQRETEQCIGFRKYFEGGYFIEVLPTFNTKKGVFSTDGIASFLVKTPSFKKGFRKCVQLYFYRQAGMVEKISALSYFFNKVLRDRPYGKDGKMMELVQEKTKDSFGIFLVSQDKKEKILLPSTKSLRSMGSSPYKSIVKEIFEDREYYHETKDPKTVPIQDIKKKRRVKNPKGAVPSML